MAVLAKSAATYAVCQSSNPALHWCMPILISPPLPFIPLSLKALSAIGTLISSSALHPISLPPLAVLVTSAVCRSGNPALQWCRPIIINIPSPPLPSPSIPSLCLLQCFIQTVSPVQTIKKTTRQQQKGKKEAYALFVLWCARRVPGIMDLSPRICRAMLGLFGIGSHWEALMQRIRIRAARSIDCFFKGT